MYHTKSGLAYWCKKKQGIGLEESPLIVGFFRFRKLILILSGIYYLAPALNISLSDKVTVA